MDVEFDPSEDVLSRAVASLRRTAIPDGPTPLLAERTLAALRSAEARAGRSRAFGWAVRVAALIALALGVAVAVVATRRHAGVPVAIGPNHPNPGAVPVVTPVHPSPTNPPQPQHTPPAKTTDVELASSAPAAADVSIAGHVYFLDLPPERKVIDTSSCPECLKVRHEPMRDESLVANADGTLQNVVVSIAGGLPRGERFPVPATPVVLDQKNCRFEPHVVVAMIGQEVVIRNSDPFLHSIHSTDAEETPALNFAQPTAGQRRVEPFRTVETFKIKCDLHPWMTSYCRTFDHPYFAVTGSEGTFTLRGLPPGHYRLKAWHEMLGVQEREVTVTDGEPAVVDFAFYSK